MPNPNAFVASIQSDGETLYVEPWGGVVTLDEAIHLTVSLTQRIRDLKGGKEKLDKVMKQQLSDK